MSRKLAMVLGTAAVACLSSTGLAQHITNGAFDANEWTPRSTVSSNSFNLNPSTGRGGATLYVEQSNQGQGGLSTLGRQLSLMYDYTASQTVLGPTTNA